MKTMVFKKISCCIYATFEESSVSCCCFTLQIDLFPIPDYDKALETVDSIPGTAESYRNLQGKIIIIILYIIDYLRYISIETEIIKTKKNALLR